MELNDLRKITCLKKSENSVERISVCNVIENLAGYCIHCLSCFYTIGVIDMLPLQIGSRIDVYVTSPR